MNKLLKIAQELTTKIAKRVGFVGPPTDTHLSVTGEPYETFSVLSATPEDAAILMMVEIEKRLRQDELQSPVLYWRVEPEIKEAKGGGYTCYARLLLSAKTPDGYSVRPVT